MFKKSCIELGFIATSLHSTGRPDDDCLRLPRNNTVSKNDYLPIDFLAPAAAETYKGEMTPGLTSLVTLTKHQKPKVRMVLSYTGVQKGLLELAVLKMSRKVDCSLSRTLLFVTVFLYLYLYLRKTKVTVLFNVKNLFFFPVHCCSTRLRKILITLLLHLFDYQIKMF